MKDQLRRLLEPAETSRADAFRWTDKRPIRQQVMSGIRRAAALIAGFGVLLASIGGLAVISDQQSAHAAGGIAAAWLALIGAAAVMIWTANRWAPFVTGFFFGPAVLKMASVLVLGSDSYFASHTISRTEVAGFLLYAIVVVALTLRFVRDRPSQTTVLDRLALTFFALAALKQVVIPYRFPPWSLLLGGLALVVAWYADFRKRPRKRHRGRRRPSRTRPLGGETNERIPEKNR